MEVKGHYYLGRIIKPVGLKGHVMVFLDVDDPGSYNSLDTIFAMVGGNLVPFIIEDLQQRPNNQVQIKFHDIDSPDQADVLLGSPLFLPLEALPELKENQFYYHEIKGFSVIDEEFGEIGAVEKVLDYPMQALLQVFHEKKEVLIPVADEIIIKVDRNKRLIHIRAPEGLIEMYLGQ